VHYIIQPKVNLLINKKNTCNFFLWNAIDPQKMFIDYSYSFLYFILWTFTKKCNTYLHNFKHFALAEKTCIIVLNPLHTCFVDNPFYWDKSITFLLVQNINDVTKFYNVRTEQNQVPLVFNSFQLDSFFTLDYLAMCFVPNLSSRDPNLLLLLSSMLRNLIICPPLW
jgi:hypothetical protein